MNYHIHLSNSFLAFFFFFYFNFPIWFTYFFFCSLQTAETLYVCSNLFSIVVSMYGFMCSLFFCLFCVVIFLEALIFRHQITNIMHIHFYGIEIFIIFHLILRVRSVFGINSFSMREIGKKNSMNSISPLNALNLTINFASSVFVESTSTTTTNKSMMGGNQFIT